MKSCIFSFVFIGVAVGHSAVSSIVFDGTRYPARDTRMDNEFGAKRIEWHFKDVNNFPWMAVTDVLDASITCGLSPTPPELKAVARAGSNVTVQWSGIIQMHQGPVMSYLGAWKPGMTPQEVDWFKIDHAGYDKVAKKWANEKLIEKKTADSFQLPSDIKPGLYILRTELLALHGNAITSEPVMGGGPQFYTHCFNVEITGNGTTTPTQTVKIPGAYKRNDPGVAFTLRNKAAWDNYVIPGPSVYQGKHESPVGPKPVVALKDTGAFPPEFEAKYAQFKKDNDEWATRAHTFFNRIDPQGNGPSLSGLGGMMEFFTKHNAEGNALKQRQKDLKTDLVKLGYFNA